MSEAWKRMDLGGGGLQQANLLLARRLRRVGRARALHALFPLGLHRAYVGDRRGAWAYRAGTLAAAGAALLGQAAVAGAIAAAMAAWALRDLLRAEDAVAAANKRLRIEIYLGQNAAPPPGYRGRGAAQAPDEPRGGG
jgi:hypothetical protein